MPVMDDDYAWQLIQDARNSRRVAPATLGDMNVQRTSIVIDESYGWQFDGELSASVAALLDTLLPVALGGPDFVIAQLGQSLDGRIATESGHSETSIRNRALPKPSTSESEHFRTASEATTFL